MQEMRIGRTPEDLMCRMLRKLLPALFLTVILLPWTCGLQTRAATLSVTKITIPIGTPRIIHLGGATGNVQWRSTFTKVLKVRKISNSTAEITGVLCGNARCQAVINGKIYTCKVYVKNIPQLSSTSMTLEQGRTADLVVSGTLSNPKWSTSDKNIASIHKINRKTYRVSGKNSGKAVIKAKVNGKTLTCLVTVKDQNRNDSVHAVKTTQSNKSVQPKPSEKQYIVSCNYNYTNARNTLGTYPSVQKAVEAINKQPANKRGQWYVVEKGIMNVIWPVLATRAQRIEKAVQWAKAVAADGRHGYICSGELTTSGLDTKWGRWGLNGDYSCSTVVEMAYELAGITNLRSICKQYKYTISIGKGRTAIGYSSKNMHKALNVSGQFINVTAQWKAAKKTKSFLEPGDILIQNGRGHAVMYIGDGKIVEATMNEVGREYASARAGDQTGREIRVSAYRNGWCEVWRPKK